MEQERITASDNFNATPVLDRNGGGGGVYEPRSQQLNLLENGVYWAVLDIILVITILAGNTLTILALRFSRKLRSVISNMFVLSLAISDMMVGVTLPFHLAFYLGTEWGKIGALCLFRFFLIILACCVSIWNLTVIGVDRYIAIMYPLHYARYMNKRMAIGLLSFGWSLSFVLASVPMFWNNWKTAQVCEFYEILPPWYMAGVITPPFALVWVCLFILYYRIWREASRQVKKLRNTPFAQDRVSDWKSVQVVLLILGCFSVCWLPYFIVACIQIFSLFDYNSPHLYKGAFSLAMANSGMNPLIYAWKNKNFRRAFALLLRCKNPDIAYRHTIHQVGVDKCRKNKCTSPKKNAETDDRDGSETASSTDRADSEAGWEHQSRRTLNRNNNNANDYLSNSHSVAISELYISTVSGQLITDERETERDIGHGVYRLNCSELREGASVVPTIVGNNNLCCSSASSSTGTEIIDDATLEN